MTAVVKYLGNLRTECEHLQSGTKIVTDAPTDNRGKGEAFSPTDLWTTALAACASTIMGIYAQDHDIDLTGMEVDVTKTMSANPRRVAAIDVVFHMPDRPFSDKEKKVLERAALTCPVHMSIHPEVKQTIEFRWKE